MSIALAQEDLANLIEELLLEGRDDSEPSSKQIAIAICSLIEEVVEANTGARS